MKEKIILIVEDEEYMKKVVQYNLERKNYKILSVATGREALKEAKDKELSLILLDLMLPDIDGFKVCEKLKGNKKTKDIPIIMVTALGEDVNYERAKELGVSEYVTKPFSLKDLLGRIERILR